jgi:hypothetical protein
MREHLQKSTKKKHSSLGFNFMFLFFFRGLQICQLKANIESNFTTVEQAILEFSVR